MPNSKEGEKVKVAIIGGGASGLCCAIEAAKCGAAVTLYEAKDRVGKKILATGNGRCNMLNSFASADDYSSPSFVRGVLEKCGADEVRRFFEELGLYTREDEEGRVYPLSNQAASVLDVLRLECDRLKIKTVCSCEITSVKREGKGFLLSDGNIYDKAVLCCGSKATVKNCSGYDLLKGMGHTVTKLMPALTKLTVIDNTYTKQLKGIDTRQCLLSVLRAKKFHGKAGSFFLQITDFRV